MTHDFADKLMEGEAWEAVLDDFFGKDYTIRRVLPDMQRTGRDRILVPKTGGRLFSVEYKADSRAAETGNLFIETEAMRGRQAGWALTSWATRVVLYIPPNNIAYLIDMGQLRAELPGWLGRFPLGFARNDHYTTVGVLVPVAAVRAIALAVHFIPPAAATA